MLPPREKNQEVCAESQTINNKAMDGNNNEICDSIWKYAFKPPTLTITIMYLNVYSYNVKFNTTRLFVYIINR